MTDSTSLPAYTLRRSQRAKNARIVVKPDRVEVVAPPHVSERRIQAFVIAQQDWIESAQQRLANKVENRAAGAPRTFGHGELLNYQGQSLTIQIAAGSKKRGRVEPLPGQQIAVTLPADTDSQQATELARHLLTHWLKQQARQHADRLIQQHAGRFGLMPRSLRIKSQKSRWGSCGPHNDINLNWLLMLAPPEILEYVVVHELCHIRHKNHSATFWELVEAHLPDYRQRRLWLKRHGAVLMQGI